MKVKITLLTHGATAVFIVTYVSGRFKRLELKSGNMNKNQYKALMTVIPSTVEKTEKFQNNYEGRVSYEVLAEKSVSIFKDLMDKYSSWYEEQTEIKPKLDGISGKSMKTIIAHLRELSANDDEVIGVFNSILDNWQNLDDFYQNQRELRQINSNINIILNQLKNGKSDSKTQAKYLSDDFRSKL